MTRIRTLVTAAATFGLAAALPAAAASRPVPAQPTSFETVDLRMTVDSCTF